MKDFARTARRAAVTAAIGLTFAAATAGTAAAGTDTLLTKKMGLYNTLSYCKDVGRTDYYAAGADSWYCEAEGHRFRLYFIYRT